VRITQAVFGHARESGWMRCGKRKDSAMRCVLENGAKARTMASSGGVWRGKADFEFERGDRRQSKKLALKELALSLRDYINEEEEIDVKYTDAPKRESGSREPGRCRGSA